MINQRNIRTIKDFHKERACDARKVSVINLGCARNLVDAQTILGRIRRQGYQIGDLKESDVAIINTCAFVEEAKRESIDAILGLIDLKKKGRLKKVIVAGCLAQRYGKELAKEFKDVDAIIGVQKLEKDKLPDQVSLTPRHFAYLKICESCYNRCSFCIIPSIKGKFVSRTIESVVREARDLDARGVKEVNVIGQDITAYGMDIYRRKALAGLLKEMTAVARNIRWIRLLYAFPAHVSDELIDVIASESRICKYVDIPLQHISDKLLHSMNRGMTAQQTLSLIHKIRERIPEAHLRTTFIVGLPGETDEDFQELLRFVRETRFEKLGVFVYSREEGTPAFDMPNQVPERVKKERLDVLMRAQQEISRSFQERLIGRTLPVLIDEEGAKPPRQKGEGRDFYLGRTEYDAPEVDGVVHVYSGKKLKPGDMVNVKITDAYEYDLAGESV